MQKDFSLFKGKTSGAWDVVMRCLFCKIDSSGSRSVEHIIPESLGNLSHVLPRGVVCDGCNNYLSREVEKPFLEDPGIKILRFHQGLQNKRGRVPRIEGILFPNVPVQVTRHFDPDMTSVEIPEAAISSVITKKSGMLLLPMSGPLPLGRLVSRFLAKVALEFMAQRLCAFPEGLDYLCDESQLDLLRNHARRGTTPDWPTHTRRIYAENGAVLGPDGSKGQLVHESDFLVTEANEWYFVLAVFGQEFAINMGGPEMEGYYRWLKENNNASPLYSGKNSSYVQPE